MSEPVFCHMLMMVFLLGTRTVFGEAEVSTARAMRGNIRRDGKEFLFSPFVVVLVCLVRRKG